MHASTTTSAVCSIGNSDGCSDQIGSSVERVGDRVRRDQALVREHARERGGGERGDGGHAARAAARRASIQTSSAIRKSGTT